ncbi:FHA domain-containing protein [Quatrionicoccus australiensis]|uniref:FHA domain-containing protein n=1 Tax=Quatrionicoccus australiensis TaxID=138118 RepID=UPI001CF85998|nr:FHA domain-containing protein [Quatrionicoccus australiensis]UCV15887.1 FHA domain-containing protein [Quatrionicoccus australiensis]
MAKMILSMDGLVLKEIQLDKERLTIGRKPHNDIQIDNLAISGEHAAIVTILNDSFLEDMNSTNGTLVNGQPIKKHFLRNNDVVELGKYKLKYMADLSDAAATIDEHEKAAAPRATPLRPEDMQLVESATRSNIGTRSNVAGVAVASAAVQLLSGANIGKELELTKTLTTLGKPGLQVAVIAKRPNGFFITHVEGTQFPIVNGEVLDAQAYQLKDHDVIEIAGIKMEFFLKT